LVVFCQLALGFAFLFETIFTWWNAAMLIISGGLNSDDKIFDREKVESTFLWSICLISDSDRFLGFNAFNRHQGWGRAGGRDGQRT
jgi:hypothetical protein